MRSGSFRFRASGGLLAATSIVGIVWFALRDPLTSHFMVRLGTGGLIAVALRWASSARGPVWAGLSWTAAIALFIGAWWGALNVSASRQNGLGYLIPNSTVVIVGLALVPAWGLFAYAARHRAGPLRTIATVLTLIPLGYEFARCVSDGAVVASVLALASAVWLVWALRRAPAAPTLVE